MKLSSVRIAAYYKRVYPLARRLFFIIPSLLLSLSIQAQRNYLDGYYINLNGDTINGQIQYKNWTSNPDVILFKSHPNEEAVNLTPAAVKSLFVANEYYRAETIEIEVFNPSHREWPDDPKLHTTTRKVFLQALIRGEKEFYLYREGDLKQFYIPTDTGMALLVYKKYNLVRDGQSVVAENKTYIGQLIAYLKECPEIRSQFPKMPFKRDDLVLLFEKYYTCKGSQPVFERKGDRVILETSLFAGISRTTITYEPLYYLSRAQWDDSKDFTAGMSFNAILPRTRGLWSINFEAQYVSYLFKGRYEDSLEDSKVELGFSYANVNMLPRLTFPGKLFQPYLEGGVAYTFRLLKEVNRKERQSKSFPFPVTQESAVGLTRSTEVGLLLGLGIRFQRLSLALRIEKSNGFGLKIESPTSVTRLFLLAGYRIG